MENDTDRIAYKPGVTHRAIGDDGKRLRTPSANRNAKEYMTSGNRRRVRMEMRELRYAYCG